MADTIGRNAEAVRAAQRANQVVGTIVDRVNLPLRPRQEIDIFIQDADVCNLFLLALIELQASQVDNDPFNYFNVAGSWQLAPPKCEVL